MRTLLAVVMLLSVPGVARGEGWGVQVSLASVHFADGGRKYNERNYGLGVQRDFAADGRVTPYVVAGGLRNSMGDRSWYAGGGHRLRLSGGDVALSVGYFAGALTYPSSEYDVLPAVLPLVDIGTPRVGLSAIYVPKIEDDGAAAVLFQLRIVK